MRFMLMMNAPRGNGDYKINDWAPEDFKAHIAFMHRFNKELRTAGELVAARRARAAGGARLVRAGKNGAAGDRRTVRRVEGVPRRLLDRRRGLRGAGVRDRGEGIGRAGTWRRPMRMAVEVRQVMSAPPTDVTDALARLATAEHLLRELAPQVLGVVARRHGDFADAEDAVQEALIAAAQQWPVRRRSDQSARLAVSGGHAPAHRSRAQRARATPARGGRRPKMSRRIAPLCAAS